MPKDLSGVSSDKYTIIGLDTSSKCIGWSLFEDGRLVTYGKHRLDSGKHGEKLANFNEFLIKLFSAHQANEVIIEMPYRSSAYGILMWYIAVVLLSHYQVYERELPAKNMLQTRTIKTCLGVESGKDHNENKALMVARINDMFGLNLVFKPKDISKIVSGDDIADAIAVAWAWQEKERRVAGNDRRHDSGSGRARTRTRKVKPGKRRYG